MRSPLIPYLNSFLIGAVVCLGVFWGAFWALPAAPVANSAVTQRPILQQLETLTQAQPTLNSERVLGQRAPWGSGYAQIDDLEVTFDGQGYAVAGETGETGQAGETGR